MHCTDVSSLPTVVCVRCLCLIGWQTAFAVRKARPELCDALYINIGVARTLALSKGREEVVRQVIRSSSAVRLVRATTPIAGRSKVSSVMFAHKRFGISVEEALAQVGNLFVHTGVDCLPLFD